MRCKKGKALPSQQRQWCSSEGQVRQTDRIEGSGRNYSFWMVNFGGDDISLFLVVDVF